MSIRQKTYPLRLSESIRKSAAQYAQKEKTSLNHFIEVAIAEKVSRLETGDFFAERQNRADMKAFWTFMLREEGAPPRPDDLLPQDLAQKWQEQFGAREKSLSSSDFPDY